MLAIVRAVHIGYVNFILFVYFFRRITQVQFLVENFNKQFERENKPQKITGHH